ncbi:MAG TPA: hypothetical protein VGO07_07635 [Candidatus Saccharimonadales bacterium]|jgi:fructose-1,6-bisphosphatase I|nr:hypothetical protein [Candidatus Saccharimonadales bacterium]
MIFEPALAEHLKKAIPAGQDSAFLRPVLAALAESTVEIWERLSAFTAIPAAETGRNNFGEMTKGVDVFARDSLASHLQPFAIQVALATEEDVNTSYPASASHVVFADPIDGSNHVSYQSSCGTFLSVVPLAGPLARQPAVSGYALYGYQLVLVLAVGDELVVTVYDRSMQAFRITHQNYQIPPQGKIYSLNDADNNGFPESVRAHVEDVKAKGYKARYNGVLVADLHRIVMEGGIFVSPRLQSGKVKTKKYFEAVAAAHIFSAGGGRSVYNYEISDGTLTSGQSAELFSAVPLVCGSKGDVTSYIAATGGTQS